ncbi:flagellar filament capping protein FliD [Oxalobacteraceae bacterium]|nr:flagellar filament capping protein FliD [Oxalobacteraceae bacterium]
MASSTISATNPGATGATADIYARVEKTLASQNGGISKLNATVARDQTKLSGLGQLQSALTEFQAIAKGLAGNGLSTSASSSAKAVVTAAAGGTAKAGTYALDIKQLAQGQFLTSEAFASASAAIGTGSTATVKVEFGTAGDKSFDANGSSKSVTIDAKNNTLDGIAAAFKAAGIDVSVVKSGTGFALAIAGASGADNSLRISVSGDAAIKDLLAYNPAGGKNLKESTAAQDALLSVNGKEIKSASNTVSKAIEGTTLTLTGKGKADVVVAQDAGQVGKNISAFVSAYNELNGKLQTLQKGGLKSDVALGQVSSQLSQLLKTGGNGVSAAALAKAGITLDSGGNLQLDDKKLKAAIALDADAVGKLFSNDGKGIADQVASKIATLTGEGGAIKRETLAIGKELTAVNGKRAVMAKALTAQANALVALYTQQAQSGAGSATGGPTSLFDMLA